MLRLSKYKSEMSETPIPGCLTVSVRGKFGGKKRKERKRKEKKRKA